MNFRTIGLNVAAATAVVAGSFAVSAPADALNLAGSFLSVEASGRLTNANGAVGSNSVLDFLEGNVGTVGAFSDGGFAAFIDQDVNLKDVTLTRVAADKWELLPAAVSNFFEIPDVALPDPGITFQLLSFTLTRLNSGNFEAAFSGNFFDPRDGETVLGFGDFTSQRRFATTGTSLSLDVQAIPTPALLPGMIGMGLAALRKRKSQAAEKAEA